MSTWTTHYNRPIKDEEQKLYDHLLQLVQSELPSQLIDRFRTLFIDGGSYSEPDILAALDKIAASKSADQEFQFILNRCCHILINRWQARPQFQPAISELIAVLESPGRPISEYSRSRSVRRLRALVKNFVDESEQYVALRRLVRVMSQSDAAASDAPLGSLIRRYPYLYEHCLLAEGSTFEQQQAIRELQTKAQRQYEIDLSQYVTYQVRRSQLAYTAPSRTAGRVLQPVKNPTLLGDRELCFALRQFVGKSQQGACSYRDVAQRFLAHSSQAPSYRAFKTDLYEYLTASVDFEYGKRQFNNQLYAQLQNTLPESNNQKLNDFLIVRTCSQLLNFLVVESPQKPQHFIFIDLISNLGPTLATALLLKIVLFCRKVKPYLEKRFSILFNHYETCTRDTVLWLVQVMENLNVALSTNFSTIDLAFINQIT